jgi:hypothetical protein
MKGASLHLGDLVHAVSLSAALLAIAGLGPLGR